MKGSYTVEAAVILPLLLCLILGFLFLNFDLWNRVVEACNACLEWETYVEPENLLRFLKRAGDLLGYRTLNS